MDGERDRTLTDEAIDREITAALDVAPSPEFRAKIRARVAADAGRGRAPLRRSWIWAWSTAAIVIILAGGWLLWIRQHAPVVPATIADGGPADVPLAPPPDAISRRPGSEEQSPARAIAGSGEQDPRATASGPAVGAPSLARVPRVEATPAARHGTEAEARNEVVVSPDDAAALRHVVAAIAAQQLDGDDIPELGGEWVPLPPLEEIVLEPITLSPIAGLESE